MEKIFNQDNTPVEITVEQITISTEDRVNEEYLNTEINSLIHSMEDIIKDISSGEGFMCSLESRSILDTNLTEEGTFTDANLKTSVEEFMFIADITGYSHDVSLENITLEALDGARKTFIEKLVKWFDNKVESLFSIGKSVDDLTSLLKGVKLQKIIDLKKELKDGTRVSIDDSDINNAILSKKLAVFGAMGYKNISAKDLSEHLLAPLEMIGKGKLLEDLSKYAVDNLVVSTTNKNLPANKESIAFADKILVPVIREWLHKDTKVAMLSNTIGDKLAILSVIQEGGNVTASFDRYTIESKFHIKDISVLNSKDLLSLCDTAITLGDGTKKLSSKGKVAFLANTWKTLRSTAITGIYAAVFGIFAIKRIWRNVNTVRTYMSGLTYNLVSLKKNHLDSIDLIHDLIVLSTKKK